MEKVVTPPASFWRGKRVLLTGHTGFKGAWTAVWLQRLGADVYGVSLEPDGPLWDMVGRPADSGFADIRQIEAVTAAFAKARPEIVIHMAAQALVQPSYVNPVETFETNVIGLVNVLEAARHCESVKAFVNVTSDKCYENREQIWAYREDEPMGGSDPYSASKGCAELVTSSYRRSFFSAENSARLASGRAGNVIGGGDQSAYRLIPDCIKAFKEGRQVLVRNPRATRPWQHVLDPVAGYLILAQMLYEKGMPFAQGWNFGPTDADVCPVIDVVKTMAKLWGPGAGWALDDHEHLKEAILLRVDATKARSQLGWRPRLSLAEALDWTVKWQREVDAGRPALDVMSAQIIDYENKVSDVYDE